MNWRCQSGHDLPGAARYDMWCEPCGSDVAAFGDTQPEPAAAVGEDALAAAWAAAVTAR